MKSTANRKELTLNRNKFTNAVFFVSLLIFIYPCYPENSSNINLLNTGQKDSLSGTDFSIGTGLTYLNGQYKELVYPDGPSVNPYLSELLWNLDNVLLFNIEADLQWRSWIISIAVSTALTRETGNMTNTDWTDYTNTEGTHWSLSRIWLDNSFILDAGIKYNINLSEKLTLPIGAGYKLNYWDWEDEVLDFIYPNPQPPDFTGLNGIDYKIIQNIFYASTGIEYSNNNRFMTGLNFRISPYINAWDLDHHILRNLYFLDTFSANLWYRLEFSMNYKVEKNSTISLLLFREKLPETVGNTYQYRSNPESGGTQTGYYPDGAGHASILLGLKVSYTWRF